MTQQVTYMLSWLTLPAAFLAVGLLFVVEEVLAKMASDPMQAERAEKAQEVCFTMTLLTSLVLVGVFLYNARHTFVFH